MPLWEKALRLWKGKLGVDHVQTLQVMHSLAAGYRDADKFDKAILLYEDVLTRRKTPLGPTHHETLSSLFGLATTHWLAGRFDRSVPQFEESVKRHVSESGPNHRETLNAKANLGVNYRDAGQVDKAIPLLEEAVRASAENANLRWVRKPLVETYLLAGESAKVITLTRDYVVEARDKLPKNSARLGDQLAQFGQTFVSAGAWRDGESDLRECLAIGEKIEPDDWRTMRAKALLGTCLLGQKTYAETEPLLLAGYKGMKQHEMTIPRQARIRFPEAVDRLIELYTATTKFDDVKKWQCERSKYLEAAPTPGQKK